MNLGLRGDGRSPKMASPWTLRAKALIEAAISTLLSSGSSSKSSSVVRNGWPDTGTVIGRLLAIDECRLNWRGIWTPVLLPPPPRKPRRDFISSESGNKILKNIQNWRNDLNFTFFVRIIYVWHVVRVGRFMRGSRVVNHAIKVKYSIWIQWPFNLSWSLSGHGMWRSVDFKGDLKKNV